MMDIAEKIEAEGANHRQFVLDALKTVGQVVASTAVTIGSIIAIAFLFAKDKIIK